MSLGTLFGAQQIRTVPAKALIKHFNLDVKVVETLDKAYEKNFPLAKIPCFVGPKGFKLQEVIAISIYCMYFPLMLHAIERCLRDEKFFHIYTVIPVLIHYVENIILKINLVNCIA
ncbi:uncharacterized protein AC631_04092 [Debaryomyces fabryi]|uniref:GST N-terminal domain-containing protein n=1 Tax=Debaryomyces fabryi TaxID=58627 RepID=A0A0V1PVP0_9ASCO|nr:uncharacterized protein AC631_04092 [Debaryomyces fabryi]KSA00133.1 hypothetical protein AC631_04092 [Debaryomyces fabryi]